MVKCAFTFPGYILPAAQEGTCLELLVVRKGPEKTLQETLNRIPGDFQFQEVLSNLHVGGGGGQNYVEGVQAVNHLLRGGIFTPSCFSSP